MKRPSESKSRAVIAAEKAVVRAAMGIVNKEGWAFQIHGQQNVVLFPGSMRRLESAIAKLKEARRGKR